MFTISEFKNLVLWHTYIDEKDGYYEIEETYIDENGKIFKNTYYRPVLNTWFSKLTLGL